MQSTQKQSWQQQSSSRATHEVASYGGYDHRSSGAMDYMYGSSNGAASNSDYKRWSSSAHAESRTQQQHQQQFQQQRIALQQQQQQQQRQQASTYETKAVSSSSTAAASQGRRRTWAESSAAFTGDSFAFGGGADSMRTRLVAGKLVAASSVAQQRATTTVHEQPCPAHGIFKDTSGFKFDRQTSSGHRLFMP